MENKVLEKEIMLGNWFRHNDGWSSVRKEGEFQWEESDWYRLGDSTLDIDNVSSIPLTEDWMKDFGFSFDSKWDEFVKGDFCVYRDPESGVFCFYYEEKETILTYVHQLQNLYFTLKNGEELERKLKN